MDLNSKHYKIKEASKAQQKYFILSQMKEVEGGTHLPSGMVIEGNLDIEKTKECFQQIVMRHEALRTSFGISEENKIIQLIWENMEFDIDYSETYIEDEAEIETILKRLIQPFDLKKPPLLHVSIVKVGENKYLLLTDLHHSISDGYSASIIAKEFMLLYQDENLDKVSFHYRDYMDWMKEYSQSDKYLAKRKYWEQQLSPKLYTVDLPTSFPRPMKNNMRGKTVHQKLDAIKVIELKEYAKSAKCSLYMVLLAAFQILISKITKQEELYIGTPVSVRGNGEFDASVGLFTNTMLLHNVVKEHLMVKEFINELKRNCAIEYSNSEYSFEDLVEGLPYDYPMNRNPLFDIMFVYENAEDRVNRISNLKCKTVDIDMQIALFDITFELIEENKELNLNLYYNVDLFAPDLIMQWMTDYMEILNHMMTDSNILISDIKFNNEVAELEEDKYYYKVMDQIANVLEKVTGNHGINVHNNFFEMGIRSVHALQIVDKLYEDYKVSITDIFKYPSVSSLAGYICGIEIDQVAATIMQNEDNSSFGQEDIAIIGMSCDFPKSHNVNEFWDNLKQGNECITFFTDEELKEAGIDETLLTNPKYIKAKGVLDDAEYFDSSFFDYSPNEAEKMDPQIRVLHECAWKAIEDAGYCCDTYEGNIGVFVGGASNYTWTSHIFKPTGDIGERLERISLNDKDYFSTRISYKLNLKGPSYSIQTACSTSLTAINLACESLMLHSSDMVLTGGVSVMLPQKTGYVYQDGMILSEDGHCRVFDALSSGTVFSDGIGLIVLKRLSKAIEDKDHIYAVIKSVAVNNDGNRKVSYTAPSITGQSEVIKKAYQKAGLAPETITYVETHGTGTRLGDPIEIEGLKTAYLSKHKNYCAIGSLKANMGHLDAAAGVAGLIKVAMALSHREIPATINYITKNPEIQIEDSPFYINTETIPWNALQDDNGNMIPLRAGISSFGFGGTNAHAILEEAPKFYKNDTVLDQTAKLIILSAKTQGALERMTQNLLSYLKEHLDVNLSDMAYTLQVGRKEFPWRAAFCASSVSELVQELEKNLGNNKPYYYHVKNKKSLVFMFSGQGSQYIHMAKDLYLGEELFREEFDHCCAIIHKLGLDYNMKELIYPEIKTDEEVIRLKQTYNAQMGIFVIEYCIAKMLLRFGIKPDAFIGHSLGEYAAACIAGVFSLEDGIILISKRAKLMQKVNKGKMLALSVSEDEVLDLIKEYPFVDIATINSPTNCVVAGPFEAMESFERYLMDKGVEFRALMTSHAFHSSMMEPILKEFTSIFTSITLHAPKIPYISNLTGTWITEEEATNPEYWGNHLRNAVRFSDGIHTLLEQDSIFVEVGPGKTLSSIAKRCGADSKMCLNMLRHEKEMVSDITYVIETLKTLWKYGNKIEWKEFLHNKTFYRLSLPTYPFKGQKYNLLCEETQKNPVIEKEPYEKWFYRPAWKISNYKSDPISQNERDRWLIFTDQNELDSGIEYLLNQYYKCTYCLRDREYHRIENVFYVNPDCSEDYTKLMKTLNEEKNLPNNILYLWEVNQKEEDVCFNKKVTFDYILLLIQGIAPVLSSRELTLDLITSNGYQGMVKDEITDLMASLMSGYNKMLQKEYRNIRCRTIDVINYKNENEDVITSIIQEIIHSPKESLVLYRDGLRLVESYDEIVYDTLSSSNGIGIREHGVYLITGGLGDLAVEIAEFLDKTYHASIILSTRRIIPTKEELLSWPLKKQQEDRMYKNYKRIENLINNGANIYVKQADVSNYEDMLGLVEECETSIGTINGVLHIAGKEGNGIIQVKALEEANKVLNPKVDGTLVLDKIFAEKDLELCILFSSIATVYGEAGQVDYIAGNSFLNSYALYANKKYPSRKTISINWDNWNDVGMAARALEKQNYLKDFLGNGINIIDGLQAFKEIAFSSETIVYVSVHDIYNQRKFLDSMSQIEQLENMISSDGVKYERPEISEEYLAPRTKEEETITNIWQDVFSIQKIGVNDNFYELGGDSLYAISIIAQLKKNYEVDLSDIFNYPTIAELANHVGTGQNVLEERFEVTKSVLEHYNELNSIDESMIDEIEQYREKNKYYETLDYEKQKQFKDILLIGSTGYLGVYLLRELLVHTDAQIHTIVRGDEKRLATKIKSYFGEAFWEQYSNRIYVYVGNISSEMFGLPQKRYEELSKIVRCIINASGKVDHYGKCEDFNEANVTPVYEMIQFALKNVKKEIHHMSTKGVAMGRVPGYSKKVYTEDHVDFGQEITNLYASSKHVAETMLLEARDKGLDTNIYRIGDIVFDRENGQFQENIDKNAVYLIVRAMNQFSCIPDTNMEFMEFTFVDFVSEAIVKLLMSQKLKNETYHLLNPFRIGFESWNQVFEELGDRKEKVTVNEYLSYLRHNYDMADLKDYVQDFLTHTHLLEANDYTVFIVLQERTNLILEKLSLKWEKPSTKQLISMIKYGRDRNFF